jgi:hypothetical protein
MNIIEMYKSAAVEAECDCYGTPSDKAALKWHYFRSFVQGAAIGGLIYAVLRGADILGTDTAILRDGLNSASYKFGPCDDTGRDLVLESHLF